MMGRARLALRRSCRFYQLEPRICTQIYQQDKREQQMRRLNMILALGRAGVYNEEKVRLVRRLAAKVSAAFS